MTLGAYGNDDYGRNRAFSLCDACGHPQMAHIGQPCHCGCTGTAKAVETEPRDELMPAAPREMYDDLWTALTEAKSARSEGAMSAALLANACALALAEESEERVGALVSLAATLRHRGETAMALDILRRAWRLAEDEKLQVMALACVVAIKCDEGDDESARRIGTQALAIAETPYLLRAVGRAWRYGYYATGLVEFRDRADECLKRASLLEESANALPSRRDALAP